MPTYTARWVLPVAGPPLPGGLATVSGDRIAAVEPAGARAADCDLGNVAVVPGLVNAHTHLDLSGARGLTPPTDAAHFTDWLRSVIAFRRDRAPGEVQADVRAGLAECLAAGITLLGDVTVAEASYEAVSRAGVRAVLFHELIGLDRDKLSDAFQRTGYVEGVGWDTPPEGITVKPCTPTCKWGISPHAPYSVNAEMAKFMFHLGPRSATHLAESAVEADLLERRDGPFVGFSQDLGVYQPDALATSWADFVEPWRPLQTKADTPRLLVHANYLPADFQFRPEHHVVYCPRTHAAFGHPPHPFRDFLSRGVRVCLGTDGLTSNPDLDILEEARFVRNRYPDFPGDQLLRMVTLSGAEAIGWADECGSLEAGKSADFVAVPLPDCDGDVYELLFGQDQGPRRTWFRGVER